MIAVKDQFTRRLCVHRKCFYELSETVAKAVALKREVILDHTRIPREPKLFALKRDQLNSETQ